MVCYHPIGGKLCVFPDGRRKFVVSQEGANGAMDSKKMQVACGRCIGCRLDRSRMWATRMMHEAQCHESNCFITLTYDDDHLPVDNGLHVEDFQRFMKRLRQRVARGPGEGREEMIEHDERVRYFHAGEYGEIEGRPHYHACLFGIDFADREPWKEIVLGDDDRYSIDQSSELQDLWPEGFVTVSNLTWRSAAYVARYILKKVTGEMAEDHYKKIGRDGEMYHVRPEYSTQSQGIGREWFDLYKSDLYPSDFCVVNGKKQKIPRYYDEKFKLEHPLMLEELKVKRQSDVEVRAADNTPARLLVREKCAQARTKSLKRKV